jgi:hypothetical protein
MTLLDREGSGAAIEVPGEAVVLALSGKPIWGGPSQLPR